MIRWILGALILAGMVSTGFVLIRPRVDRPVLSMASLLPTQDPRAAEIANGVRLALGDHDERGGAFRVRYVALDRKDGHAAREALYLEEDAPHEFLNSSYASLLAPAPDVILPGLGKSRLIVHPASDGGILVPLPLAEDGRRAVQAIRVLGMKSLAVICCHTTWTSAVEGRFHSHVDPAVDRAAQGFYDEVEIGLLPHLTAVTGPDGDVEPVLRNDPQIVYLDLPKQSAQLIHQLRERGFAREILVPAQHLEPTAPLADGCLAILAHLTVPSEFDRRYRSRFGTAPHPLARLGDRSARRFLEALDRTRAATPDDVKRAFADLGNSDPIVELAASTGVYRIRAGRFELLRTLP